MRLRYTHPDGTRVLPRDDGGPTYIVQYGDEVVVNQDLGAQLLAEGTFEEVPDVAGEEPATHVQVPDESEETPKDQRSKKGK